MLQLSSQGRGKRATHGAWCMEKEKNLQVVIVDDHALVRKEIRSIVEGYPGVHVVGEGRNGLEAIFLVEKFRPKIVLMDINMPKMNGIEATAQITTGYPDTVIIGFSVDANTDNQQNMIRAGAVRLIQKEKTSELLYDAIREALKSRNMAR